MQPRAGPGPRQGGPVVRRGGVARRPPERAGPRRTRLVHRRPVAGHKKTSR